jgi:hypothetical protein
MNNMCCTGINSEIIIFDMLWNKTDLFMKYNTDIYYFDSEYL